MFLLKADRSCTIESYVIVRYSSTDGKPLTFATEQNGVCVAEIGQNLAVLYLPCDDEFL